MILRFNHQLVVQIFLLIAFGFSILSSYNWPLATRLFILVVALPGFLTTLILFLKTILSNKLKTDVMNVVKKELLFFAWLFGFLLVIWLFGLKIALPLYSFLYLKIEGKKPLWVCLVFSAIAYIVVFVLAAKIIGSFWPSGVFLKMFGM